MSERPDARTLLYAGRSIAIYRGFPSNVVTVEWRGQQTPHLVRVGCDHITEAVTDARVTQIFNDNTHVVGTWDDAELIRWAVTEWYPGLWRAGVLDFAWVQSPHGDSRAAAIRTVIELEKLFPNRCLLFNDAVAAWAWLEARRQVRVAS